MMPWAGRGAAYSPDRARGWLLVALALGAVVGMPAHAADEPEPEPVVVARDGTVELVASDGAGGEQLCIAIRDPRSELASSGCDDPLPGVAAPATEPVGHVAYLGVAVPAATASVEVRRIGKVVGGGITVAGDPYRGFAAGLVRFALVRVARDTRRTGLRVHARDAAGELLAVLDAGGDRPIERRRLLSGRVGGVRWSLREQRASVLDPTTFDLARETVERCVGYEIATTGPDGEDDEGSGGASDCTRGTLLDELLLDIDFLQARERDDCSPSFRLLHGIVPASTRRVSVLLGDGRRRIAATVALRDGTRRVWGLAIAPGDAVRSVRVESVAGRGWVLTRRLAPVAVDCALRDDAASGWTSYAYGFGDDLPAIAPVGPVATLAGPPAFRVADGPADTLCLALGDKPFTATRCELVAPTYDELLSAMDDYVDPRAIVFAVPANVAEMRLSSVDRKTVLGIPTVAAEGYGGRYTGSVRFAAATVSRWYDLARTELLDSAGRVLHRQTELRAKPRDVTSHLFTPRRVAGRIGAPSLWRTRFDVGRSMLHCLALTAGPPPSDEETCESYETNTTLMLDASCTTRRLTVAIAVRTGTRVFAEIGGTTARRVKLRNGAGLLTLRPGSPLHALRLVRERTTRRVRIDAPPAAAQCGWEAFPQLPSR